MVDLTSMNV